MKVKPSVRIACTVLKNGGALCSAIAREEANLTGNSIINLETL